MAEKGYFDTSWDFDHDEDIGDTSVPSTLKELESVGETDAKGVCFGSQWQALMASRRIVVAAVLVLSALLAMPLLVLNFWFSQEALAEMSLLGVTFSQGAYLLLLCAVFAIVCLLFFMPLKPMALFVFFGIALFCCFPVMIGIRHELTLLEAISSIPLFAAWPFFLRPMYVLLQCMIPCGCFLYLAMQVVSFFTTKTRQDEKQDYTFLVLASFLLMVSIFGVSMLHAAGQTTVVSLFKRNVGVPGDIGTSPAKIGSTDVGGESIAVYKELSSNRISGDRGTQDMLKAEKVATPSREDAVNYLQPESHIDLTVSGVESLPGENASMTIADVEQKLERLLNVFDRKIQDLDRQDRLVEANKNQKAIALLNTRLDSLSQKMEAVLQRLEQDNRSGVNDVNADSGLMQKAEGVAISSSGAGKDEQAIATIYQNIDSLEKKLSSIMGRTPEEVE